LRVFHDHTGAPITPQRRPARPVSATDSPRERYWRAHLELIDRGGVVLTATRRQARALARIYAQRAGAQGRHAWDAPPVSALSDWLAERWRQGSGDLALLHDAQALYLWRAEVEGAGTLLDSRTAARAARAAYSVARDYELDWSRAPPASHEQRSFRAWSTHFHAQCRERARLDSADLLSALTDQPPERINIGLHGFERSSTALLRLLARWAEHGVQSVDLTPSTPLAVRWRAAPESPQSELEAIGEWCLERLTRDPGARLAVLIPDLAGREAAVERSLAEYLQPSQLRPGEGEARLFASARSPPLSAAALIDAALGILALGQPRMTLETLGRLLRSPYLGGAEHESHARARADARLRDQRYAWLDLAGLPDRLAGAHPPCPRFAEIIAAVRAELSGPSRRGAAAWSAAMARALRAAGWPAGRPLRSHESRSAEQFSELLSTLASLEAVGGALSLDSALEELSALAAATEVQAGPGEPSVLVFDGLAELGYALDGLYVAGLSAERLPGPVAPDPFLPGVWQREQRLPRASASIELERAQSLIRTWSSCAEDIVFSCPLRDDDGVLAPSPLIAPFPERLACARRPTRAAQIRSAARLDRWLDEPLPALAPAAPLRDGVTLLELQSICPFRAGAELRLRARPLTRRGSGIDALMRGQLLHAACTALWRELKDSDGLAAAGPEGRAAAVARAVDAALSPRERRAFGIFAGVERQVLARRLQALLDFELTRAPFRVARTEWSTEFTLADRPFKVRIDRIDETGDHSHIVIDYKSGQATPKRWTGPHPDRPQVAAYAAHLDPTPLAAVYLHLGADPPKFSGLAAASDLLPGIKATHDHTHSALKGRNWENVILEWRSVTDALARAFAAGASAVTPTREACRFCQLEGLCRVPRPTPPGPEVAPDEEEEADDAS
jgi:ATP-dependent helicase/nuclease subunit B